MTGWHQGGKTEIDTEWVPSGSASMPSATRPSRPESAKHIMFGLKLAFLPQPATFWRLVFKTEGHLSHTPAAGPLSCAEQETPASILPGLTA